ncbi:MAG: hypothetical protein IH840_08465 [Candidatus Heimdallarchaeota archaeon]|nr:hypothetical protein [Candidatus Heimdallarchaeota archaeon]
MALKKTVFGPPIFRLLTEVTTWVWLFLTIWPLAFLAMASVALLNFPGDKKPAEMGVIGKAVPGWVRIFVEISSGMLGIFVAWLLFDAFGFNIQVGLTSFSFYLDRHRWRWMLGRLETPPNYVTATHKLT